MSESSIIETIKSLSPEQASEMLENIDLLIESNTKFLESLKRYKLALDKILVNKD